MFEFATYEGRHRTTGSATLAVLIGAFAALYVGIYPSLTEGIDLDELLAAYPEPLLKAFGVESLATVEGFLASELYTFVWILLLGLYVAYAAAALIADDVDRGRMDLLLSMPVSRARVVIEKYLSLLVPIVVVNVTTPVVVYVATQAVGHPIDAERLVLMHLLSVPYLLACGALGLVLSVLFDRASLAQRAALGLVFGLFLLESLVLDTDYEAAGAIAPMRYLDPNAVLVDGQYDLAGAAILIVATVALAAIAVALFRRKDVQ